MSTIGIPALPSDTLVTDEDGALVLDETDAPVQNDPTPTYAGQSATQAI